MYSDWVWLLVGLVGFIWFGILTFLVWQQNSFLRSLFPKGGERDIRKKFEEVVNTIEDFRNELIGSEKRVANLESEGLKYLQKVKLLRYNPYDDTGGDQSFSVSFLDKEGNGIVLTSLHARSGTRVFAKPVLKGKKERYELSKEEQDVID